MIIAIEGPPLDAYTVLVEIYEAQKDTIVTERKERTNNKHICTAFLDKHFSILVFRV